MTRSNQTFGIESGPTASGWGTRAIITAVVLLHTVSIAIGASSPEKETQTVGTRQELLDLVTSAESQFEELPEHVAALFFNSAPDEVVRIFSGGSYLEAEVAIGAWFNARKLPPPYDSNSTEWALYLGTPGKGYLAIVRDFGSTSHLAASIDSLEGFGMLTVHSFPAETIGLDGLVLTVTGMKGLAGILKSEILYWNGRELQLLSPSEYRASQRYTQLSDANWEWRDLDGDSLVELILHSAVRADTRVYRIDTLSRTFVREDRLMNPLDR